MDLKIVYYHGVVGNEMLATVKGDEAGITLSAPYPDREDPVDLQRELKSFPLFIKKIHELGLKGEELHIEEEEIVVGE